MLIGAGAEILKWQHDERQRRRDDGFAGCNGGRDPGACWKHLCRGVRHLCDKAIASAGHRLNAASPNSPLIEHPAKRPDLSGQVAVGYGQSGPDRAEDFVLGHEISAARYQQNQQVEGARAERHRDEDAGVTALE
jgi:hypothetical protein